MPKNKKQERIGETRIMNCGMKATIIEYRNSLDIDIVFEDGTIIRNKEYSKFQKGQIYNNSIKNKYFGILGNTKSSKNGKLKKSYKIWCHMLERCYDNENRKKYPTYKDCYICDEWLIFENFEKWFDNNYYQIEKEIMCLDKDILVKGNKNYSPNTCIFVPDRINSLFTKNDKKRGKHLIGVHWCNRDKTFVSQISIIENNKKTKKHLGNFKTELEAFETYKKFKENYIKQVADEYKGKIPDILYNAMYNWKVDIND